MGSSAFCIGLGYSIRPLADDLLHEGWSVTGTTRSQDKAEALRKDGLQAKIWDSTRDKLDPETVFASDVVIVSVAPSEGTCPVIKALGDVSGIRSNGQILYLSSSGVYGDYDGAWIDETATCRPGTARGKDRLAAENQWTMLAERTGCRLTLCRLAGIYGPGRSAIDSLSGDTKGARAGLSRRVVKPGQVFNRI
ncbi:MAG: NAD-dependent epimerase/dehydratase family protein, partial [Pseudomonadota bacterium]